MSGSHIESNSQDFGINQTNRSEARPDLNANIASKNSVQMAFRASLH